MPLYEYECDACGHRFEVIQKFSDPPIEKCSACGSPVHKLQSAPAFQFKGTGWYVTDYAKSGSTAESKGGKDGKKSESAAGASDTSSGGEKAGSSEASPSSTTGSSGSTGTPSTTAAAGKSDAPKT